MSKQQLIESIREQNPSANQDFLTQFDEQALHKYLDHLGHGRRPRGQHGLWVRGAETPAVVTRHG
jgi:hypothetical protein